MDGLLLLRSFLHRLIHRFLKLWRGGHGSPRYDVENEGCAGGDRPDEHDFLEAVFRILYPTPDEGEDGADNAEDAKADTGFVEDHDKHFDPADDADEANGECEKSDDAAHKVMFC